MDLFSRKIIAWTLSKTLEVSCVIDTINKAKACRIQKHINKTSHRHHCVSRRSAGGSLFAILRLLYWKSPSRFRCISVCIIPFSNRERASRTLFPFHSSPQKLMPSKIMISLFAKRKVKMHSQRLKQMLHDLICQMTHVQLLNKCYDVFLSLIPVRKKLADSSLKIVPVFYPM